MPEIRPRTPAGAPLVSPADRLISEVAPDHYKLSEVAQILKVSESTLRRMLRDPGIKAPSLEMIQRGMKVYLYSKEDIDELRGRVRHIRKRERDDA